MVATMSDPKTAALEFAAEHLSSDWPERCQEIVRRARAALAAPAAPTHLKIYEQCALIALEPEHRHRITAEQIAAAIRAAAPAQPEPSALPVALPKLPFAVFDEFGNGADDRVQDYGRACALAASPQPGHAGALTDGQIDNLRGLDTASRVRFYEHDFYVLSNFSAFTLVWKGIRFDTSEAAYHYEKFTDCDGAMADVRSFQWDIRTAPSAHEAFKIAERNRAHRRPDWDAVKVGIMLDILRAKAAQHEYVRRKLLATGDRELVEDSWRDDFWGWGPNRDGKNMLGRLWMQVRSELRGIAPKAAQEPGNG